MKELTQFFLLILNHRLSLLFAAMVAVGPSVLANCVAPADMVGWWRGEGSAIDSTGFVNGNPAGHVAYAAGRVGVAFNFDGNGDAIQLGNPPNLQLQDFTIEAWIKRHSITASSLVTPDAEIFCHGEGGYGFGMWSDGRLFLTKVGSDNITASVRVSDTNFHHVAITKSGTQVTFYIDGVSNAHVGYSSVFDFVSGVAIGARGDDLNNSFFGLVDELSVYSRALSNTEIMSIFAAANAGKCRDILPPSVVIHPESRTAFVGSSTTFSALVAGDSLTYQWLFNGADIAGANSSTLILTNISLQQAGSYTLLASNSVNTAASADAILAVNVPPPCEASPSGLVSWWKGEGNFLDMLGPNDGTNSGNVSFAEGEVGTAFNFDGVNDLVGVPPSASLDVGAGSGLTIECWMNPADLSTGPLVEWNRRTGFNPNPYGPSLWISFGGGAGSLYANLVDTFGTYHDFWSTEGIVQSNVFQHVSLTYDKSSGVATLYHNGNSIASQSLGTFQPRTSFPLYFGHRPSDGGSYFQGQLDEVTIYNRALTVAEIQAIYAASVSGKCVPSVPPVIHIQPTNQSVRVGTNVALIAKAAGTRPLFYQWIKDGLTVAGATNSVLVLSNIQPSAAGVYALRATNAFGDAISSNALLKVTVVSAFGNGQPLTNSTHTFNSAVTIQLQNAYPNGLIFYTLDGSAPTFASAQYTSSFIVSNSIVLRALGYRADFFEAGELDPISILLPPSYPLTVKSGGGGTVSVNPPSVSYLSNTVVSLTATPNPGWQFLQWLDDLGGANPSTNLTMNRPKSVRAVFGTTLSTTAAGGGTTAVNPSSGVYPFGANVQISAIPNAGNQFALWGNAASGNVNPLAFVVTNANPTVSSLFAPVSGGQAALTVVPFGLGQVSVSPRANVYATGTGVTITATPASGQVFLGWSGDATGTQNPQSITMTQNKLINANFTAKSKLDGERVAEGFRVTLTGDYFAAYQCEASTNLANWLPLAYLTNVTGTVQFTDTAITNAPARFYRALRLP